MKDLTIRRAKPVDWKIIQKLNFEVFEDNIKYDPYCMLDWAWRPQGIKYFKKVTRNKKLLCLIAEVDNKPVGYIVGSEKVINYRKVKMAEITNMGVSPQYRSKGVGTKLVIAFKNWAKKAGFDTAYVNAYAKNASAIKFYKRAGFSSIDVSLEMVL